MKTPNTPEMVSHMLAELGSPAKPLSAWEEGFIESVSDWFEQSGRVSERQFEVLERIYAEKTA